MNEKFFSLPPEKQQRILNAGFRVFSQNSYKKSPMSEIAAEAGISKALLFHYFRNKQELYLFLWDWGAKVTIEYLTAYKCYEPTDLFEMMERGMQAKFQIMARYPHMAAFAIKAFYEKDPEVCEEIQKSIAHYAAFRENIKLLNFDPEQFVPGIDPKMMYLDMYWASEGYLWEKLQGGNIDVDEMERDFLALLEFWKKIYLRKEG